MDVLIQAADSELGPLVATTETGGRREVSAKLVKSLNLKLHGMVCKCSNAPLTQSCVVLAEFQAREAWHHPEGGLGRLQPSDPLRGWLAMAVAAGESSSSSSESSRIGKKIFQC